jgi:hypothetical protein
VARCEGDVGSGRITRGRKREACQRRLHHSMQAASPQRIKASGTSVGLFEALTERLRPMRNAAACWKSTRSSAPEPVALDSQASWLRGPRSRSECGLELAPGGVTDGNYAHFPALARELSPAPGPRRLSRSKVASWGREVLACLGPERRLSARPRRRPRSRATRLAKTGVARPRTVALRMSPTYGRGGRIAIVSAVSDHCSYARPAGGGL